MRETLIISARPAAASAQRWTATIAIAASKLSSMDICFPAAATRCASAWMPISGRMVDLPVACLMKWRRECYPRIPICC